MSIIELLIIAAGLSMDAFAIAVCIGLSSRPTIKNMIIAGLYFGIFQAIMPIIGFYAGYNLTGFIVQYDHIIAFALLAFLGGKMVCSGVNGIRGKKTEPFFAIGSGMPPFKTMLPLAVATSIDALAIGLSFALVDVSILPAAAIIGATTFFLSAIGVRLGGVFGAKNRALAEVAGGAALILMGIRILLQHNVIL
ncbi:MAG: manganese efflux pump MntP family protein [Defluviitaleaceae bacterium]|nr:manganese efflux pump MntP family protein [Defluviitaleaceae bacterium]MCL2835304.1 manganese efflux pump MntP family protein [Defluviitaleaceae bacterium]